MAEVNLSRDGRRGAIFPAGLVIGFLLLQLALLLWSAFPEYTMKSAGQLESWYFLAGGQVLFLAWVWPLSRTDRRGGGRWARTLVEAALLLLAAAAAAVPATWWANASAGQVLAPACYLSAWAVAAVLAVGIPGRAGFVIRWMWGLLLTALNFGVLALEYVAYDFLDARLTSLQPLCPVARAAELAEAGWPALSATPMILPIFLALVLATVAIFTSARHQLEGTAEPSAN